jgi:hypothetical protein
MTLFSWGRRRDFRLPAPEARYFQVTADTRVLAHCYWQPERTARATLLALHGLEGSSEAHYMRGLASKALDAGMNAVLLNQRNCGGTEALGPGLYHSGLTQDAVHVIDTLTGEGHRSFGVAGYSLGGNLALKLAGDYGDAPPPALRAVCAVSPILEIGRCVDALERRANVVYQWNFVRGLRARIRRKGALFLGAFPLSRLRSIHTVRQFDEHVTAPHFGFAGATDYYHRASAMRVIDRIRVPTLIISAADDPFIPADMFDAPEVRNNPHLSVVITAHGGHCGFVAAPGPEAGDDGYWAEVSIIDFMRERGMIAPSSR